MNEPQRRSNQLWFCLFCVAVLALFWLSHMLVHELGHVATAWATGGTITYVDVRPWRFSTTLVSPNPHPSLVIWGGILGGWLAALATVPIWRWGLFGQVTQAWAAFCWLSMGCYVALAGGETLSDSGALIGLGWSASLVSGPGVAMALVGYFVGRRAVMTLVARREEFDARRCSAAWLALCGWWFGQALLAVLLTWMFERG